VISVATCADGDVSAGGVRLTLTTASQALKLFGKAKPGNSVQIDVKVVKIAGTKAYQYTARDFGSSACIGI